ncbi:hypothetical protein HPB51_002400 [Rhipicephalus microplus]|uniref:Alpha-carbonic anhydrase domain-containing protein n=1 Tax=Rhipicephalus microplus TaxID=6941 RepID=A0A9J6DT11_RHIMP|nr:hypothetical protein HPB51_002400 [Rhipicephalus microplus]
MISGIITNTGHGVIFRVSDSLAPGLAVNISGGPLSYQYRFHELHIHYGRSDDRGSEHTIAGKPFPAELQIFGYNSDLYANMSEAVELRRSEGLVGISILLQLGDLSQSELRVLTGQLHRITYRDSRYGNKCSGSPASTARAPARASHTAMVPLVIALRIPHYNAPATKTSHPGDSR